MAGKIAGKITTKNFNIPAYGWHSKVIVARMLKKFLLLKATEKIYPVRCFQTNATNQVNQVHSSA